MHRHHETRRLPYSPEQMFDLVADVASYPQFLPWLGAARVRPGAPGESIGELVIGFGGVRERFTSRIVGERPERLRVEGLSGPLKLLANEWTFAPDGQGGCVLHFRIEFAFRSRLLDALAARVFPHALKRTIAAFEARAAALYAPGSPEPGISSSSAHSAA